MCKRSKAWLAASVRLRLARLPPPASRMRRSRRLRDTLAAAPGLLAHACVTGVVIVCPMGPKLRHTGVNVALFGLPVSQSVEPKYMKQYSEQLEPGVVQQSRDVIRTGFAAAADSDLIVFVEDDFLPCPGALSTMLNTLQVCYSSVHLAGSLCA